jgi:hypothetical protein
MGSGNIASLKPPSASILRGCIVRIASACRQRFVCNTCVSSERNVNMKSACTRKNARGTWAWPASPPAVEWSGVHARQVLDRRQAALKVVLEVLVRG